MVDKSEANSKIVSQMDVSVVSVLRYFGSKSHALIIDNKDFLAVASSVDYPGPIHNAVILKDTATCSPPELIVKTANFFGAVTRRYILWIRSHADGELCSFAQRHGFVLRGSSRGTAAMFIARSFTNFPQPASIEVSPLISPGQFLIFRQIIADAFENRRSPQPKDASLALFSSPEVVIGPDVIAFLAYCDGLPAGAAMIVMEDNIGSLCWVSTLLHARRRGVASSLTAAVTNAAFERGVNLVALQSGETAEEMYLKMGFVVATRYLRLVSPGSN